MKTGNRITEILNHDISWHAESINGKKVKELPQNAIEDILSYLSDGCSCGELVFYDEKQHECAGWWEIVNWRNFALSLYHELNNRGIKCDALEKFNVQWDEFLTK